MGGKSRRCCVISWSLHFLWRWEQRHLKPCPLPQPPIIVKQSVSQYDSFMLLSLLISNVLSQTAGLQDESSEALQMSGASSVFWQFKEHLHLWAEDVLSFSTFQTSWWYANEGKEIPCHFAKGFLYLKCRRLHTVILLSAYRADRWIKNDHLGWNDTAVPSLSLCVHLRLWVGALAFDCEKSMCDFYTHPLIQELWVTEKSMAINIL